MLQQPAEQKTGSSATESKQHEEMLSREKAGQFLK
jgi:hypothetical protein